MLVHMHMVTFALGHNASAHAQSHMVHKDSLQQGLTDKRTIQAIPEAAVLLASERNVKSGAAELAALERWAPAPLLEATALLAGASGSDDRVRAYALRSLTDASRPEEVTIAHGPCSLAHRTVQHASNAKDCTSTAQLMPHSSSMFEVNRGV
jgi:hypothetical protein